MEIQQLFHYTSLDALFAIIKDIDLDDSNYVYFKLRASNAFFLNDLTEGQLLPKALIYLGATDKFLSILQSNFGYPFVVSLSELDDDLNMWRCYANNGKGVSIGLDKEILSQSSNVDNSCRLDKCKYVTIEELAEILRKNDVDKMIENNEVKPIAQLLLQMLVYKDKSFSSEAEWRIHDFNFETKFRISDNVIVPYREIRVPVTALQSITIGPKCDFDRNRLSIYRLLKSKIPHFHNVKITKSTVPLF